VINLEILNIDITNDSTFHVLPVFFTENMLEYITTQTNLYAEQEISKAKDNDLYSDNSRFTRWKSATVKEIQTYVALMLRMFQITISKSLIISRQLKNSNIEHKKFTDEIICQLLNDPEPKKKRQKIIMLLTSILRKRVTNEKNASFAAD